MSCVIPQSEDDNDNKSPITMRCTEVASRPLPDGQFTYRDIGDRGRYGFQGAIEFAGNPLELSWLPLPSLGLALLLWPIIEHGPAGTNVPPFQNDDSRRLHNEMGLSIIVPERWACLQNNALGLHLHPMTPFASRSRATMSLARLFEQPDLSGCIEVRFRDCAAWEKMYVAREYSIDDGALSVFRLYIQHPTGWIEFTYSIASETETLPASIREYIQSIGIVDSTAKNP